MSFYAYPPAWAQGDALRAAARRWQRRGLLTPAQQAAIEAAHSAPYFHPNNWIRVILFGATCLGASAGLGFLVLVTNAKLSSLAYSLLAVLATVGALEWLLKASRHYRSGVDNALLYGALLAWGGAINLIGERYLSHSLVWLGLLLLLMALLAALVRYADSVVAIFAFGTGLALLIYMLLQVSLGVLVLPFAVVSAAAGLHVWLRRLSARADYAYYANSLLTLRTLCLLTIYLAGNYFVMREGFGLLQDERGVSKQIPLAPLFYVLTVVTPLVYVGLGLRRHDRLLLNLGLLAGAFSLFTLRYYYALLPPAVAATLGGAVLLAGALAALRYLRTPRHGLTTEADADAVPHLNLETFIVAQTAHAPTAPEVGLQFGGGHAGGGGAGGRF